MQFTVKKCGLFFSNLGNTVDTNLFYSITSNTVFSLHIYQTNLPLESLLVTIFDPMASNKRLTQVSWSLTLQDRGFRERQVERKLKKSAKKTENSLTADIHSTMQRGEGVPIKVTKISLFD